MHLRDEATEVEQTLGMAAVEELDASLLEDVLQSGDVLKSFQSTGVLKTGG